ncbi:ATP-binding protein [Herminiimonas sp. CN]|uniref:ATP-binding protein n=1 Tax=Herminiimonas sp. CN TaxID=1349818 RepID=UPI0004741774|nr:ATP-binding protein [Herminiimonas sp. CN]
MKNFFNSMTGRVFLILLCGMLATIALTFWLSDSERQRTIGQFREAHQVERAEQLTLALDALPAASRQAFLETAKRIGLRVESAQSGARERAAPSAFAKALGTHLGQGFRVASIEPGAADCQPPHRERSIAPPGWNPGCEIARITLRDGTLLRMTILPPHNGMPPLHRDFLLYLALFVCSIGVLAYLVARMTMRPLKQLAQAAFDLGLDLNHPPLALAGSSEIRQAGSAFNAMQGRIRDHIQQRTQMLAAITHDLQTPLTRLRLRLEKVADIELRSKLVDDLSAMQDMVREGLELARSMASAEPMQRLDLDSLLDSVCSDALDAGQPVTLSGHAGKSVLARPNTLRRCLINLIDNAVKYGQSAAVSVAVEAGDAGTIAIRIRDHGPGIAPDQLARVFEPFYRIETSRSRQSGGTGLGLTIARNIAEQHGGSLTLRNHPDGGLEALLTLPQG